MPPSTPNGPPDPARSADVAANLAEVQDRIAAAARSVGRDPASVTLLAVSKMQPEDRVLAALDAGHRHFAENRVQEARARWTPLKTRYPGVELHLVGPLQTNKIKEALGLFDWLHTIDRPKLAEALSAELARAGRRMPCLVEVNTGEEDQKAGVAPLDTAAFVAACQALPGLDVRGLMCIPPQAEPPALHFALLADLAKKLGLATLSMGMSGDYETAVRLGATHVRVGTAIFGERN